jgi:hypothetical protein
MSTCPIRLDGDAHLALEVHIVEKLLAELAIGDGPQLQKEAVRERALAVVDVCDDGEIPDPIYFHRWILTGRRVCDRSAGDGEVIGASARHRNRRRPCIACRHGEISTCPSRNPTRRKRRLVDASRGRQTGASCLPNRPSLASHHM